MATSRDTDLHIDGTPLPDTAYTREFQIRLRDLGLTGHIENVTFLRFFDEARFDLFGAIRPGHRGYVGGVLSRLDDRVHYLIGQHIVEYRSEVWPGATVTVGLWVPRIGGSSFVLNGALWAEGAAEAACVIETSVIFQDHETERSWTMDDRAREILAGLAGPRVALRPRVGLE